MGKCERLSFMMPKRQTDNSRGLPLRLSKAFKWHAKKALTYVAGSRVEADGLCRLVARCDLEVISFDLFDTFVGRCVSDSRSLFIMVAEDAGGLSIKVTKEVVF